MASFSINKHYNFSTYASSVLGVSFRNARLVSIMDYDVALKFDNVELYHKQIYPYLPENTIADNTKYTYLLFEVSGVKKAIADVWIIPNSIEETSGLNYTIKLKNVTTQQLSVIRNQLTLIGVSFEIV